MIRYRCPACGAPMVSPAMEAGMQEHCPQCGKATVIPQPTPAPVPSKARGPRVFIWAAVFGVVGLAAGLGISLVVHAAGGGGRRDGRTPPPIAADGAAASQEDQSEWEARGWEREAQRLAKDLEAAKMVAGRAEQNLSKMLADGNLVYMPSVPVGEANDVAQLAGIRRVQVVFTGSDGVDAVIGGSNLKTALETALSEDGFTIDSSQPDALVLLDATLIPSLRNVPADGQVYCVVECHVSRQVFLPGAGHMTGAVVWTTEAVGTPTPADTPKVMDTPREAVQKVIAEVAQALTKAKG